LPWSVIRSDGPLGEPVAALRVTPPQPKLSDGTLIVLDGVPDEAVVLPDDVVVLPDEVVVPPDEVVVPADEVVVPADDGVPVGALPVDVLPVEMVPEDGLAVDDVALSGEVGVEDSPPAHPTTITETAAAVAAAVKVERIVMAIAASSDRG
jgi:hypothetical protein